MTREIGPELVARMRHVADSLEAIARGEVDSPQPFIAAYAVYIAGEYDSSYGPDAIDEAMEIAAECNGDVVPLYRTPQTNATPGEGSVSRNGSVDGCETVTQKPFAEMTVAEQIRAGIQSARDHVAGKVDLREAVVIADQKPVAWAAHLPPHAERFDFKMIFGKTPKDVRLYGESFGLKVNAFPLYSTPPTHATRGEGSAPDSYGKPGAKHIKTDTEREPVAWLAVAADGSESSAVYALREQADATAREWGWLVVPLYRSPTLTAEEREAIAWYAAYGQGDHAATLRSLLERTK